MFGRFKALQREAAKAEKEAAAGRREVAQACARTIHSADVLADQVKPERVGLRKLGVATKLPADISGPVREVLLMAADLHRKAAETPIEEGLLGWHRDP